MNLKNLEKQLIKLEVCGEKVGHNRFLNLKNIERLVKGETYANFGINNLGELHPSQVLAQIAKITGCSTNLNVIEGTGYISPKSTINGLQEAAKTLASLKNGSKILMATGHPGSMLSFYIELGRYLKQKHEILIPKKTVEVKRFKCPQCGTHDEVHWVDYIEGVAFITDGDIMMHTHEPEAMENILEATGKPNIILADHGFIGPAVNSKIKTITVMDTNDPVIAVAKDQGADLVIIPMDDNKGNVVSGKVAELLISLVKEI